RGNTLAQFSERQNAQEQLRRIGRREKRDNTMIRAEFARLRDDIGVEKIAGHKWSKLDGTAGVAVVLDRELIDLGPTEQIGFKVRHMRRECAIIFDRENDRALRSVTSNHLRPFGAGALNHLAEVCFCVLNLPSRHFISFSYHTGHKWLFQMKIKICRR